MLSRSCEAGLSARQSTRPKLSYCATLMLALLTGGPVATFAQSEVRGEAPATVQLGQLKVGLNGIYKTGRWAGLEATVTGSAGTVCKPVVRTSDPDGDATYLPLAPVTIPESGTAPVRGLFRSGRLQAGITLEIQVDGKPVAAKTVRPDGRSAAQSLRQADQVWVIVGDQPAFVAAQERWDRLSRGTLHVLQGNEVLDNLWTAEQLEAVNLIVLNANASVSESLAEVLQTWVARGGRIVIPVGDGVSALARSPLSTWLPLKPTGQTDVRNIGGLSVAIRGSAGLRMSLENLPAAQLDATQGTVLASGLTGPLVMRAAYGLGQVTMVSIPLDQPPLSTWESGPEFAMFLSNQTGPWEDAWQRSRQGDSGSELNPTGISDLETQIVNALDSFPEVDRPSHWVVMGWIALFALLIGPIDYLVLHRYLKHPEWTWFTLPVWVTAASLFAISRANAMNERPFAARQIDLIDVDATAGLVRAHSWYGFYSPRTQRSAIETSLEPVYTPDPATTTLLRTSWVGVPEEGFRGMYRTGGIDNAKPSYSFPENRAGIFNLPTLQWSTGTVSCEWESRTDISSLLTFELNDVGGTRVAGSFSHQLPGPLVNWFLAYGDFGYFPIPTPEDPDPALMPGEHFDLNRARSNVLRNRLIDTSSRQAFDPLNEDPLAIAQTLTFHKVTGGSGYTRLNNSAQLGYDLSELLQLHRAVLFGQIKIPATSVRVGDEVPPLQDQFAFVRIVLPVERQISAYDSAPSPDILKPRN